MICGGPCGQGHSVNHVHLVKNDTPPVHRRQVRVDHFCAGFAGMALGCRQCDAGILYSGEQVVQFL
jgi:hypothetical protein